MPSVMSPHQYQQNQNIQSPHPAPHEGPVYHVCSPVASQRDGNSIAPWSYVPVNPVMQAHYAPYYNMPYHQHTQNQHHPQALPPPPPPPYGNLAAAAQDPSVICYSCGTHSGTSTYPFAYYPTPYGAIPDYYPANYPALNHHTPVAPSHFQQQGPMTAAVPALEYRRNSCSSSTSVGAPHTPSMSNAFIETPSIVGEASQNLALSPSSDRFMFDQQRGAKMDKQMNTSRYSKSGLPPTGPHHVKNSLYNPSKTTNVYVRGLGPDMDDEKLLQLVKPYGKILSCKSIVDKGTGLCKGYGFALFEMMEEAKACILGMAKVDLDAGFARESFNSRLKGLGDPTSTNLYVSNLPTTVDEAQMRELFKEYPVMSARVLLDAKGISRGVGFVRFSSHNICDQVIAQFNDKVVYEGRSAIQVRYADTHAQKTLKDVTTKVREFYCNEQKRALEQGQRIPTGPKAGTGTATGPGTAGGRKWSANAPRPTRFAGDRRVQSQTQKHVVVTGRSQAQATHTETHTSAPPSGGGGCNGFGQ